MLSGSQRSGHYRHSPTRSHDPHACSSHVGRRGSLSVRNASPASADLVPYGRQQGIVHRLTSGSQKTVVARANMEVETIPTSLT